MRNNLIVYDNWRFDDMVEESGILSGECFLAECIAGEELQVDTLTSVVRVNPDEPEIFAPKDYDIFRLADGRIFLVRRQHRDFKTPRYGDPVEYYHRDKLISKFYVKQPRRVAKDQYELNCVSAIGLLDGSDHIGGIYTGQTVPAMLAEIIGGAFPYTVDPIFASVRVFGWLPMAPRRSNLRQLLFATGAAVRKSANGDVYITVLSSASPALISDDRIVLGGNIDYQTPVTRVEITEHSYIAYTRDERATLYEGDAADEEMITPLGRTVRGILVKFDGPHHDLHIETGTIIESSVNYAVLAPSSNCVLTGQAYTHMTRVITKNAVNMQDKPNICSVTDATLVSLVCSENVAERVLGYYSSAQLTSATLLVGDERPGDAVAFTDPFGDHQESALLQSLSMTMGGMLTAGAVMASGYAPTGVGNNYTQYVMIAGNTTWTAPADVTRIRVVLIGGGPGGYSGAAGITPARDAKAGEGGAAGIGGTGGNVYIASIAVRSGEHFAVQIGSGGAGGVCAEDGSSVPGAEGGATVFGSYTTAAGKPMPSGVTNILTGALYGYSGEPGISGGKGDSGEDDASPVTRGGETWVHGGKGENATRSNSTAYGGYGGGAAVGANGADGGNGSTSRNPDNTIFCAGGDGGNGADATHGDYATVYGCGGHGGGGGGAGGVADSRDGSSYEWNGNGGAGGRGGQGGQGASGCVIVYF